MAHSRKNLKDCIRNFTPAWFTIIMGTGVVSALISKFHFGADSFVLKVISLAFFLLNLCLFMLLCGMTAARYWLFPKMWSKMLSHPAQSLFVGAFPMGAATLINSALTTNQKWSFGGTKFIYVLWAFWWADLALSYLCAFSLLFTMMTTHHHSLTKMASVWVLPMVTLIVASSTGGLLADALLSHSVHHALITTAVSLTGLIIGLSLALMIITVYLTRLILHGPPDVTLILSAFVAVGPFGQGGFSLLINGYNLSILLPLHSGDSFPSANLVGQMLYSACFCGAWILWSMGIAWIIISLGSIYSVASKDPIPFSLAYWGLIFPNGVFALLSVQLGLVLDSSFFNYFGAIWSIIVFLLWAFIFIMTIPTILNTSIFVAPCIGSPMALGRNTAETISSHDSKA